MVANFAPVAAALPSARAPATALTPAEVFRGLASGARVAFLDGRAAVERAPLSHLAWNPLHELRIEADGAARFDGGRPREREPLGAIDEFLAAETAAGRTVIGALGYELAQAIEPKALRRLRARLPLAVLHSYAEVHCYDHRRAAWVTSPPRLLEWHAGRCRIGELRAALDEDHYTRLFERVHAWIAAGDVYQVNLSIRFRAAIEGDPRALYAVLADRHPVPYGAYLDCGDFHVLSNSPELFLARRGDRIETRPIKGTRPRGDGSARDARLESELRSSEKERAEHVMIVDLERSDLGRVARSGSVEVTELASLASYPTLHHLESRVVATLRPGLGFADLLRATFPGGSITGAPKIRAIQIIDELEHESRDLYTGAILHYPPSGDFTMSLAIRTATAAEGELRYASGGGLVWDSQAASEYAECWLKAKAFLDAAHGL